MPPLQNITVLALLLCFTTQSQAQDPSKVPTLLERLGDPQRSPPAIRELAAIGEPAVPELTRFLESPKTAVQCDAAKTLALIGPKAHKATPALIKALSTKHRSLRRHCSRALTAIGAAAIPELIKSLETPGLTAFLACDVLVAIGEPATPALLKALQHTQRQTRGLAATALGRLKPDNDKVLPALIQALDDKQAEVRAAAAEALGLFGANAKDAVPQLTTALLDPVSIVRADAAKALGNIGAQAKNALPALGGRLADPEKHVQQAAQKAINQIKGAKETRPDNTR